MHRFFIPPQYIDQNQVIITDSIAHQIRNVLRMRKGDHIIVLDNQGWEYKVILTHVERDQVVATIKGRRVIMAEPNIQITLYQGIMKKRDTFEWVLQKCTEVGVTRFVPLMSQRSLIQTPTAIKLNKIERWQKIIKEAAEQSGRGLIPRLLPPVTLKDAMRALPEDDLTIIGWAGAIEMSIRETIRRNPSPKHSISLFIGPEGGFADGEVAYSRACGAIPVTLGKRILRAETAALVASSLVLHEYGEME